MTTTILIIVNVFAALAIIVLALMQQSKGDMGSAFGGGGSQSMFGSRGSANFLSRLTATMCVVFFVTSLSLAYVYAKRAETNSVVQNQSVIESSEVPAIEDELPTIEGEVPSVDGELPTIDSEIPVIEGPDGAEEQVQEAANDALEALEQEVPDVPQQ
ncbi:MAG: preprotein translocase subunit SecG [Pseudomonadota bacterium]